MEQLLPRGELAVCVERDRRHLIHVVILRSVFDNLGGKHSIMGLIELDDGERVSTAVCHPKLMATRSWVEGEGTRMMKGTARSEDTADGRVDAKGRCTAIA